MEPRLRTLRAVLDVSSKLDRIGAAKHPERVPVLVLDRDAVHPRGAKAAMFSQPLGLAALEARSAGLAGMGERGKLPLSSFLTLVRRCVAHELVGSFRVGRA
jgi:hypothetical protein